MKILLYSKQQQKNALVFTHTHTHTHTHSNILSSRVTATPELSKAVPCGIAKRERQAKCPSVMLDEQMQLTTPRNTSWP
jgi:hypothetical protein